MKRLCLVLLLALAACYERGEAPPAGGTGKAPATAPAAPAPKPNAVPAAVVAEEALDTDGDGKLDTWRKTEPDGVIVERKDTDGDGKPDQTKRLEPLQEAPPGIELQLDQAVAADACAVCGETRGGKDPCPHCGMAVRDAIPAGKKQ